MVVLADHGMATLDFSSLMTDALVIGGRVEFPDDMVPVSTIALDPACSTSVLLGLQVSDGCETGTITVCVNSSSIRHLVVVLPPPPPSQQSVSECDCESPGSSLVLWDSSSASVARRYLGRPHSTCILRPAFGGPG